MELKFIELANTELSDKDFFERIFLHYIRSLYKDSTCVEDLAEVRTRFKQNKTNEHLKDQIEAVLYRHNNRSHETANADKMEMKQKIDQLEEKIDFLMNQKCLREHLHPFK
jgi:hypothetical protein